MAEYTQAEEYITPDTHIVHTKILFCGHQKCEPRHAYGPAVRTHYLLVYVHAGKGTFKTQNTIYHLQKGCSFFIFPGEVTYYQADADDPWEYSWVAFTGGVGLHETSQILLRASITAQRPVHMAVQYQPLEDLFRELVAFSQNSQHFVDLKILSLFYDIMYRYIVTNNSIDTKKISSPLSSHLDLAIEYIKCYYHRNISVSEIAQYLGIRREYFCMLFKKQFEISPVQFLKNYRLKVSSTLLITSHESIVEIAYRVGYSDYNYYSNSFRKLYGISPSQYRKLYLQHQQLPDPFRTDIDAIGESNKINSAL